jgi:hypothetical protein
MTASGDELVGKEEAHGDEFVEGRSSSKDEGSGKKKLMGG